MFGLQRSLCANCEDAGARVAARCDSCQPGGLLLCADCDAAFHKPARMSQHRRVAVSSMASSVAPAVPSASAAAAKPTPSSSVQVYCVCRGVDDGRPMIDCNSCTEWYHLDCLGLSNEQAELLFTYKCAACQKRGASKHTAPGLLPEPAPSAASSSSRGFSLVGALPDDCVLLTLSFLSHVDVSRMSRTSRSWRAHCEHPLVWNSLLLTRYRSVRAVCAAAATALGIVDLDMDNIDSRALFRRLWQQGGNGQQMVREHELHELALSNARLRQQLQQAQNFQQQVRTPATSSKH